MGGARPACMDRKICKIFVRHNTRLQLNVPALSGFFVFSNNRPQPVTGTRSDSNHLLFLFALCYFVLQPLRRTSLTTKLLLFWHIQWRSTLGS